jgi:hypothetical protein
MFRFLLHISSNYRHIPTVFDKIRQYSKKLDVWWGISCRVGGENLFGVVQV